MVLGRKARDVTHLGQETGGDDGAHAEEAQQCRSGGGHRLADLSLERLDATVKGAHVP